MRPFEIFKTAGKLMYRETENALKDDLENNVWTDFAIRVADLADFLTLAGDKRIPLSPDCPLCDHGMKPLEPSYLVSDVKSLVVFEEWSDEGATPALALYKADDDGRLIFRQFYGHDGKDIPQRLWEIVYPQVDARAMAKIQRYFFCNDLEVWYFIGEKTKTLYAVDQCEIMTNSDFCGVKKCNASGEPGVSDGLRVDYLHQKNDNDIYYFNRRALAWIDYDFRKLKKAEDFVPFAHSNPEIETILHDILTEEEFQQL